MCLTSISTVTFRAEAAWGSRYRRLVQKDDRHLSLSIIRVSPSDLPVWQQLLSPLQHSAPRPVAALPPARQKSSLKIRCCDPARWTHAHALRLPTSFLFSSSAFRFSSSSLLSFSLAAFSSSRCRARAFSLSTRSLQYGPTRHDET